MSLHTTNGHSKSEPFFAGRLSKQMSPLLLEWNETPRLAWEVKHLNSVIWVDEAHTIMLAEQGLITKVQAGDILRGLDVIKKQGPQAFVTQPGYGSIVLQIEQKLSNLIGEDTAGRLPIGRSRLDQGAAVKRLADRDNLLQVHHALLSLQSDLIAVAKENERTPMVSYTHLQQAQPANFGHYLLAFTSRLEDCQTRLQQLYDRVDRNPLGTVGLSGTDLPVDRIRTTKLLGFSDIIDNARTGRDAYYQVEIAFVLATIMMVLNDLCCDLHIFNSIEFGTIEIDDCHCSTSSIFPQKKNPYAIETVKGKAGDSAGWVAAAMATLRNEGSGDTQARTVACLSEAYRTTTGMLDLTAEVVRLMKVRRDRWERLLSQAWVTTNRFGNILLNKHGLNYRSAHGLVARVVKYALDHEISKGDVSIDLVQQIAGDMNLKALQMTQDELTEALDHGQFLEQSISLGSVGPKEIKRLLIKQEQRFHADSLWEEHKTVTLADAQRELDNVATSMMDACSHGNGF